MSDLPTPPNPPGAPEPAGGDTRKVLAGIALTFGLHVAACVLLAGAAALGDEGTVIVALGFFLLLGVTQLVYMVPAIVIAYRTGRRDLGKGLVIGTAITFILSGACWAIVGGISGLFASGSFFR
jgi:hypothetical protein